MDAVWGNVNNGDGTALRKTHAFISNTLDSRQQLYVDARAAGSVPVVAARVAGYTDPDATAARFESDATMRLAVESTIRVRAYEHKITRDDILEGLQDALRNAATSTEQRLALESIAKLLDMYSPKRVEVSGSIDVVAKQIKDASDTDLAALTMDAEYEILDFEES